MNVFVWVKRWQGHIYLDGACGQIRDVTSLAETPGKEIGQFFELPDDGQWHRIMVVGQARDETVRLWEQAAHDVRTAMHT